MSDRLKSMQRVLRVRETMRRQAEWKLAACERQAAELRVAQGRLFAFLEENAPAGGALTEVLARNARGLSARIAVADRARADQAGRALEEARKSRLAERRCDDLAAAARRERERRDLAEQIERAGPGGANRRN